MRKIKFLSLIFGILISVLPLSAQESIEIPFSSNDSTEIVRTLKVEFERPKSSNVNVNYKNVLESLTEDQINNIITTFKESNDASLEMSYMLYEALVTFNSILEEKAFMENKVIHQAKVHYNLSESEVKRSLRSSQTIDLITYFAIFTFFLFTVIKIRQKACPSGTGMIDIGEASKSIMYLCIESFAAWYVIRPALSIMLNRDFEIIKFLLQGA